jgi:hypothetical protein
MKKYISLGVLFAFPLISSAAFGGTKDLIKAVGGLISSLLVIVAAIALLVFFWGLAKFILKANDPKANAEGKNLMIWGIIALFVMVSVWGIVAFMQRELGLPSNIPAGTSVTGAVNGGSNGGSGGGTFNPNSGDECVDANGNNICL